MNPYFLTLVLKADQDESARKELLANVEKKLTSNGKIKKQDHWGVRDLAYPIQHRTKGFYAHFELEADPALAKDLDKTLRVEEDIIRYLLVRDEGKIRVAKIAKISEALEATPDSEKEGVIGRSGR